MDLTTNEPCFCIYVSNLLHRKLVESYVRTCARSFIPFGVIHSFCKPFSAMLSCGQMLKADTQARCAVLAVLTLIYFVGYQVDCKLFLVLILSYVLIFAGSVLIYLIFQKIILQNQIFEYEYVFYLFVHKKINFILEI